MDKDRYLITGAGGFIGGWIAEALFLEGKDCVRASIHRWSGAPRLARFPMEIMACDILNPTDVDRAMTGITHVIHCAKGSSAESIVAGTENMLEAAVNTGVKRFIYMSTAEVYGDPTGTVEENFPCLKTGKLYGDSKLDAEEKCLAFLAKGLAVTILRPSIVYGPFSKTWIINIGLKLQSGTWGTFKGVGQGSCNLIYINDLVNATLLCARDERAIGETFNVNGPEAPTWNEYFVKYNAALGLPALKEIDPNRTQLRSTFMEPIRSTAKFAQGHFQKAIITLAANYEPARNLMKCMEKSIKLTPRPAELSLYARKAYYSAQKIGQKLGWKAVFDVDVGLKLSAQWMEQIGGLK